jgi:hypothetical protein
LERKKASWVTHLLLVLDGRKKEELLDAAKVLVEIRTERRRCACLFGGRKRKKLALGIACSVEWNRSGTRNLWSFLFRVWCWAKKGSCL